MLSIAAGSVAQTRYALLVGIGQYPADSGWATIHGDNDVNIVLPVLLKQGFSEESILTLINEAATKGAIVAALNNVREKAQRGDVVYIHFSGHGQQVTDLDGDEDDHYDEAWVPFDAAKRYEAGVYEGQNHILDDELNLYLNGLRAKVGPEGKIVVVSDACHSGSGSRGSIDDDLPVRGTNELFVIPVAGPNVKKKETPVHWLFVGACKPYQINHEYYSPDGHFYGSLSFVIVDSRKDLVNSSYKEILDIWRSKLVLLTRYPQDMDEEGRPSKRSSSMF
jgi:hypothetical protein